MTVKIGYSHIGLNYLGFYFELSDDPQLPHHSGGLGADGDEAGAGHGIGIEARDYPIFTKPMKARSPFLPGTYDLPVEEGMVISIEVPYGELGLGGFQVEYTLLVKKDGCEKLYPHKRELVVL